MRLAEDIRNKRENQIVLDTCSWRGRQKPNVDALRNLRGEQNSYGVRVLFRSLFSACRRLPRPSGQSLSLMMVREISIEVQHFRRSIQVGLIEEEQLRWVRFGKVTHNYIRDLLIHAFTALHLESQPLKKSQRSLGA